MSDFLCLVLVNLFRISQAQYKKDGSWLYGVTMCDLNPFLVRYFIVIMVVDLVGQYLVSGTYYAVVK